MQSMNVYSQKQMERIIRQPTNESSVVWSEGSYNPSEQTAENLK